MDIRLNTLLYQKISREKFSVLGILQNIHIKILPAWTINEGLKFSLMFETNDSLSKIKERNTLYFPLIKEVFSE